MKEKSKTIRCICLAALCFLFCPGCAVYVGLDRGTDRPLSEPAHIPDAPDKSGEFDAYGVFAVETDPSPFPESMLAMDMGPMGVPAGVGTLPLRKIAARNIQAIIEHHFRSPRAGERPAFSLGTIPQALSVRQDGELARVKISIRVECIKQDAQRTRLLSEVYTAETTGPWVDGKVPMALYEALDEIWQAFLSDFPRKIRPSTLLDGPEPLGMVPRLVKFDFKPRPSESAVATGTCLVECNGWPPGEAEEWVKKRIFNRCVKLLGATRDRIHVRYGNPQFDSTTQTLRLAFKAWKDHGLRGQFPAHGATGETDKQTKEKT